eukprot:Lithocolla_globosa_v1_NODE_1884_length_2274_cov_68.752141.p2 type:complete len:140 gc:universal NODE_1884_length_2274_cov_68.752141:2-421(+)
MIIRESNLRVLKNGGILSRHVNTRSLNANFDNLTNFLNSLCLPFSVIGINELWLNNQQDFSNFSIEGYKLSPKPRTHKGGGVGVFVRENIKYTIRNDLEIEECDNIWIELDGKNNKNHLICSISNRKPGFRFFCIKNDS